jgi:2-keto-3-deoxy-L-fuconate dehydrogenase
MRVKDHVAIVTGGASGIGRATAALFLREGARVAVVDWNATALDELTGALDPPRDALRTYSADVTDTEATSRILDDIAKVWSKIDILVTAAGISIGKTVTETAPDQWRRVLDINVGGTFDWIRAVLPGMVERGSGAIVTVGSQLSTAGGRSNAAYVVSKGAIASLMRSVALDYANSGVRCNCVAPGATDTPLLQNAFARSSEPALARQELIARHAMRRLAAPHEIASAILYLASAESSFVTGTQLVVDGGWLVA